MTRDQEAILALTADNERLRVLLTECGAFIVLGTDEGCEPGACAECDMHRLRLRIDAALGAADQPSATPPVNDGHSPAVQPTAALAAVEKRMKELWQTISPVPTAQPGSYNRGYDNGTADTLRAIRAEIDKAHATPPAQPIAALDREEREHDQTLKERDHAEEMADKLAAALAMLLGVEIGEHSNMNCPWEQALEAFEERAASTVTQDAAP